MGAPSLQHMAPGASGVAEGGEQAELPLSTTVIVGKRDGLSRSTKVMLTLSKLAPPGGPKKRFPVSSGAHVRERQERRVNPKIK